MRAAVGTAHHFTEISPAIDFAETGNLLVSEMDHISESQHKITQPTK
jgi:hypothetical protein